MLLPKILSVSDDAYVNSIAGKKCEWKADDLDIIDELA